ncbi:MAG: anthranilate phosphoribosyltransferase [Deltaproteobacteria bacterium]|nr:anthranilate phosphoribosyltransferase [Deltaproteobacteria bacterium]
MLRDALGRLLAGETLDGPGMEAAMGAILAGEGTPAQVAGFAVALRMRGETTEQIAAAARTLRAHCDAVELPVSGPILDTCGTGGDGAGTFNVSTVSAIVVAACGVKVAKHGNRSVSSRSGSADVLEALGVAIDAPAPVVVRCLEEVGITFLFAPAHHQALRHAATPRRELGARTVFNLLGPLVNPAGATHQLVGVYDPDRVEQLARVLGALGTDAAWVVHGADGLDEIAPHGPTQVAMLKDGEVTTTTVSPADFEVEPAPLDSLAGGDAKENAAITRRIFEGKADGARVAVLLNAGAALCVAGAADSPAAGAAMAAAAIDEGRALATLDRWIDASQGK